MVTWLHRLVSEVYCEKVPKHFQLSLPIHSLQMSVGIDVLDIIMHNTQKYLNILNFSFLHRSIITKLLDPETI